MKASPAKSGDYFEFFAEIGIISRAIYAPTMSDLLAALSTCPAGSLELPLWGPNKATNEELLSVCHPLKVQVWKVGNESLFEGWKSPRSSCYRGMHGLKSI